MNAKEYLTQLAQAAELSQEERDALLKVADKDKFAKGLEEGVMLRSDYSRAQDQLKTEKERTGAYYQELVTWKASEDARLAALTGNGNGGQVVNGEYLTRKDIEALDKKYQDSLKQQEASFITISKMMGRLASQHAVEFREPLDTDLLEKTAIEKQLPLPQAYEAMVATRRSELQNQSFAAKLAAAKEEGAREFASKHRIPVDTSPREQHHVFYGQQSGEQPVVTDYQPNTGRLSQQSFNKLREGFAEEFNKQPASTSTT